MGRKWDALQELVAGAPPVWLCFWMEVQVHDLVSIVLVVGRPVRQSGAVRIACFSEVGPVGDISCESL